MILRINSNCDILRVDCFLLVDAPVVPLLNVLLFLLVLQAQFFYLLLEAEDELEPLGFLGDFLLLVAV